MKCWANYFNHEVCTHTMSSLENFAWHRVIRWLMRLRPPEVAQRPPAQRLTGSGSLGNSDTG